MFFVYILQSLKDSGFYVGMSKNIEKRLARHNAGQVKSTSHRRPFRVIYQEPYSARAEAREREKYLKSYKGSKEKLTIIDSAMAPSSNG